MFHEILNGVIFNVISIKFHENLNGVIFVQLVLNFIKFLIGTFLCSQNYVL